MCIELYEIADCHLFKPIILNLTKNEFEYFMKLREKTIVIQIIKNENIIGHKYCPNSHEIRL